MPNPDEKITQNGIIQSVATQEIPKDPSKLPSDFEWGKRLKIDFILFDFI